LWWFDANGRFRADRTWLAIWGRSAEDLATVEGDVPVCFVQPEDRAAAQAIFAHGAERQVEGEVAAPRHFVPRPSEYVFHVVVPNGESRWVLCRRDSNDEDGEHGAGIAIDLTAQRRGEDARQRARALEIVSTLAARLAHDFNNLLFAILGNATLSLSTMPGIDTPVRDSLREIERAATRASDLVQRLSTFARPVQPRRQLVKLGALVETVSRTVRESLPPSLTIRTNTAEGDPALLVDPRLVQELVSNLLSNAVQAMQGREGAILIEIEPMVLDAQPWAKALGLKPGPYVELRVLDSGIGMDATTLRRCLDPFYSTRPKGKGMGIGLCIAQSVARSHGGVLRVESTPEVGTTVRAYFAQ
jgi:signal transduction histidine kinase